MCLVARAHVWLAEPDGRLAAVKQQAVHVALRQRRVGRVAVRHDIALPRTTIGLRGRGANHQADLAIEQLDVPQPVEANV